MTVDSMSTHLWRRACARSRARSACNSPSAAGVPSAARCKTRRSRHVLAVPLMSSLLCVAIPLMSSLLCVAIPLMSSLLCVAIPALHASAAERPLFPPEALQGASAALPIRSTTHPLRERRASPCPPPCLLLASSFAFPVLTRPSPAGLALASLLQRAGVT